jgi:hypothetical protein
MPPDQYTDREYAEKYRFGRVRRLTKDHEDAEKYRLAQAEKTMASSSNDDSDDELENRFQESQGVYLFREGKPRAVLEVKSPQIPAAIYEARLRGYDWADSMEAALKARKK